MSNHHNIRETRRLNLKVDVWVTLEKLMRKKKCSSWEEFFERVALDEMELELRAIDIPLIELILGNYKVEKIP